MYTPRIYYAYIQMCYTNLNIELSNNDSAKLEFETYFQPVTYQINFLKLTKTVTIYKKQQKYDDLPEKFSGNQHSEKE